MYDNYSGYPAEEKQKKKILIISILMGVIILALIIFLISAIVKKNRLAVNKPVDETSLEAPAASDHSEVAAAEPSSETNTDASAGNLSPVEGAATASSSAPSASVPATTTASIPQTGPESVLGLTLLAGTATAYLTSKRYARARIA